MTRALKTFGAQFGLELRSSAGTRSGGGSRSYSGRQQGEEQLPRKVGGARVVKKWADAREGMTIPGVRSLMGISALGDREVGRFMSDKNIDDPEQVRVELDRLVSG